MDKVLKGLCRRINTAINNLFNLIIFFTDLTVPFLHIRQLWFARTFARFSDILHTWWLIYDFLEWKISLFPITKWHSLLKEKKKNVAKRSLVARKQDEELPNASLSQGACTMQDKSYNYSCFAFYCQSKRWRIHAHWWGEKILANVK